eukprot:TRINITY_DN563_c0_g1_i2.p1 TRINITY_DN563_c0_g1~~TRINITY_DN563_c0_g1_i2.p1  ORF type:complete len:200 (+),score=49.16 TRINITY_DN563_c0_g1_i2:43-642(+)
MVPKCPIHVHQQRHPSHHRHPKHTYPYCISLNPTTTLVLHINTKPICSKCQEVCVCDDNVYPLAIRSYHRPSKLRRTIGSLAPSYGDEYEDIDSNTNTNNHNNYSYNNHTATTTSNNNDHHNYNSSNTISNSGTKKSRGEVWSLLVTKKNGSVSVRNSSKESTIQPTPTTKEVLPPTPIPSPHNNSSTPTQTMNATSAR